MLRLCISIVVTVAAAAFALIASPAGASDAQVVDVHRTHYGVVHVEADTEFALAYGLAHAYASDNVCLLADFVVTVNAERSRYFGAEARTLVGFEETDNLTSDFFFGYYISDAALEEAYSDVHGPVRELIRGFVAGYNAYLSAKDRAQLPAECRNAPWVRPLTERDMFRMLEERAILGSGSFLFAGIVGAAPPAVATGETPRVRRHTDREQLLAGLGSNGWAFGSEATASRRGLLLANPHFPWETINRFYQVHLRLRGQFDVMGAMLPPFPVVTIGFNHDVAWTHTVSTAQRFTLFELTLAPDDPRTYLLDGVRHRMTQRIARVAIRRPDGRIGVQTHTFYETVHGPVVSLPGFEWDAQHAYAVRDVNRGNTDMIAAWLKIARARNVAEIRGALAADRGLGWINTVAADREGAVLFADVSRVPNVSQKLIESCRAPAGAAAAASEGIVLLDGARNDCRWYLPADGAAWLPVSDLPAIVRHDYVANSNDSYWLVNARSIQPALSPILGPAAVAQRLRTRVGLEGIESRLAGEHDKGAGRMRAQDLEAMLFSNRNYSGELLADDVLALCEEKTGVVLQEDRSVDLQSACSAIARWDRRSELDSRGAALFREFWRKVRLTDDLYAEPFDPRDPVHTPRGLNLADPGVRKTLRTALAEAAHLLRTNGFAADVRLGDIQGVVRNGRRIEIHGGDWYEGVLNQNMVRPLGPQGYVPFDGSSYIQIVELNQEGPVAHGLLTYSQSTDPGSPYYADQTRLYSKEQLYRLPFTDRQIRSDPFHRHERLSIPPADIKPRDSVKDRATRPAGKHRTVDGEGVSRDR